MREVYDDSQRTAGQKENLKAVVETPQKPRSMTTDGASDPRVWYQKHMNKRVQTKKRTRMMMIAEKYPTSQTTRDHEMEGETLPEVRHSSDIELKPRRRSAQKHKRTCS